MGTFTSRMNLAFHLRTALEQWTKEYLGGPWDDLIDTLSEVIDSGQLSLSMAARIDHLLAQTLGRVYKNGCQVCDCPMAGMAHVGGPLDQGDAVDG
jgi:hypothetical protein